MYSFLYMCLYIFASWINCVWITFFISMYILELHYICLGNFLVVLQVGVWVCIILPSHTHIMHIISGALYPGLCNLELKGIV